MANTEEIARRWQPEIDAHLVEGEIQHPDPEVTPWRDDELVVFCAPGHRYAKKRALSDADLARGQADRARARLRHSPDLRPRDGLLADLDIVLALEHTEAIRGAVVAGLGLGCVSRIALQEAFDHGTLAPCRVPHRDFRRAFYFLLNKHKYRGRGLALWLALCREAPSGPSPGGKRVPGR